MLLKQIRAIFVLPVMVTLVIPALLLRADFSVRTSWSEAWQIISIASLIGIILISLGLMLMIKTITLFAIVGRGTLALWDPTQKLVVKGVYRYVRNPMISGVFCILLGEAFFFYSYSIFLWFLIFVSVNLIYIPLLEERELKNRFGDEYMDYKKNVPRWIPRLSPWERRPER
jgi:protein-S-isoprenylcysteine O-methyltransferase Ste14